MPPGAARAIGSCCRAWSRSTRRATPSFAATPTFRAPRALLGQTGEFSTDAKEGPILAQSWYVLERIRRTVEAAGGRMDDVVKLVQYLKNLDHFPYYSRVRKLFFGGEPPASTVVEVSAMLPSADILIEVEATAYLPAR